MNVPDAKRRPNARALHRRRVVAVIGSGTTTDPACVEIGQLVASLGADLLTGGGRGVMEAVSRAFFESQPRKGIVVGVIPATVDPLNVLERRDATPIAYELSDGYPNPWVELAIYTHLPDSGQQGTLRSSRNHINVLSADVIVALPGEAGTESEMWLAVQYGVPTVAYSAHRSTVPMGVVQARTLDEVRAFLLEHLPTPSRLAPSNSL
jgi:predicted Rossmann-fold nucleotide-binding protein